MFLTSTRRLRCWLVMAALAGLIVLSGPRAERWGDNFQIGLPLLALGCQVANGKGGEYLLRYVVLFTGIHGSKLALGDAPVNRRPSGSTGGMPSGHTATAVFGASTLIHDCVQDNLYVRAGIVIAAAFTGASRIEASAHSIWQVLIGALWGLICDRALRRSSPLRRRAGEALLALRRRARRAAVLTGAMVMAALPLRAETVISVYGGAQSAPHSTLKLNGDSFTAGWDGKSFTAPPYWGARVTRWRADDWGWGAEITHAKIYADGQTLAHAGTDHLEFSDGMNIATVNLLRRWPQARMTPYAGMGLGVAVPHVEFGSGPGRTFEYQLTGPAMRAFAGIAWPLADRWQAMAEYQFTYSRHDADLTGGDRLETDILTNALNVGLGWRF